MLVPMPCSLSMPLLLPLPLPPFTGAVVAPSLYRACRVPRQVRTIGHSLGGGVAALLALLLKPAYPSVRALAVSPPGGLVSEGSCREVCCFRCFDRISLFGSHFCLAPTRFRGLDSNEGFGFCVMCSSVFVQSRSLVE